MKRGMLRILALLLLAAAPLACATRAEVADIVAESNAAMLNPDLVQAGSASPNWKESVQKIEQFIAQHPDQKKLNAALRVREALLLTINGSKALAKEIWALADVDLLNPRDKCLHRLSGHFVWWFGRAGVADPFADGEKPKVDAALGALEQEIRNAGVPGDLKLYLATMRANIALKRTNSFPEGAAAQLASDLAEYAGCFPASDTDWVVKNFAEGGADGDAPATLRPRINLINVMKSYRAYEKRAGLTVAWKPDWVAGLMRAIP